MMVPASRRNLNPSIYQNKPKVRAILIIRAIFKPEFLNRIDDIIIFNALGPEEIKGIVGIQIGVLSKRLEANKITLKLTENAEEFLANTQALIRSTAQGRLKGPFSAISRTPWQ